ncbi:PilZ domain-containing protein [Bradyrhizobium jicamae]|uniref:PilZ domain-containing protein n=1 Tax=Bradyrhizobium jicamae TaxID=280332 RepID=A0ABS5FVP5_9BRAD|nr:PilZ domain-containing protein [Bradyrhizobium jicamae]
MIVPSDKRKSTRHQALDEALIRFGDLSMSCTLQDVSDGGAAVQVAAPSEVPDEFKLVVPRSKTWFRCRVIWREGAQIGVAFV